MKLVLFTGAAVLAASSAQAGVVTTMGSTYAESCYHAAQDRNTSRVAMDACDRALALEPLDAHDRAGTFVNRGILRMALKNYEGALRDYDAALAINPNEAEAWLNKAIVGVETGKSQESVDLAGKAIADLRKRSLLKRLLFLIAGSPAKSFTKEEIVQRVWGVDYHPLRHDAALFTNIMRLRRLLGQGGDKILRVGEAGYRLVPPPDFLFVEKLGAA